MASKKLVLDLLEQEVEDFIQTQAEKVIEFEDDPMAYILNKYPSLKDTLTDLMTKHFGDYVTGIYVMAPKPTTFKVLLHNGQFYYLTYAKDSYIAKIQGKKYYLLDLGAEEYAIKAIADLLTMGKPPGAKGPDDQEDNVTITDTETTTDVDITDDGGGDDDLSEAKEKNPETDDYGRPFIDPKGSRTYMDPDEMTPAARARKMMGEKNEKEFKPHMMYDPKTGEGKYAKVKDDHLKLKAKGWGHDKPKRVANEKKIRIVKESVEKKKSPLKFKIVKEGQADKKIRDIIIQKNPGFITQSKDKRIGNIPKVSDEEFVEIIKNTFDIDDVKVHLPNKGPNNKLLNPTHSSKSFSMFEFKVDGKTYSFILSGGAGANKGQAFEDEITLGLQNAMEGIEDDLINQLLNKLNINLQDIKNVEQTGGQDTKRTINPEAGPQNRGKTISDVTIETSNGKTYYLSIKNKTGDNIYNGGAVSSITYDNKSNTVSFNKNKFDSDKLKSTVFNMFNIDPVKVTDGLNRYIKEEGDVPEWEPINIDKNEVIKFIGSAIDYGYYYVREEGEGVKVIHLETPEDVSKLIGQITNAQIKYPGNGVKSTYARIGLENSEQGLRYIEVQIRNASGGIANPVIKVQTK